MHFLILEEERFQKGEKLPVIDLAQCSQTIFCSPAVKHDDDDDIFENY